MSDFEPQALTGAMLAGVFGAAWAVWGAAGLHGPAAGPVRIAGIAVGLLIFACSAWLRWSAPPAHGPSGSMFSAPGYRLVVVVEAVALFGGGALLGATGHSEYTIAWYAAVVGVHFVVFGRLYWEGFYLLGAGLLAAAVAGTAVGLAGGGTGAVKATAGLMAAACLLAAGAWTLLAALRRDGACSRY